MKNKSLWGLALSFIILSGVYTCINNLDRIYALGADFYFKKNEISKAQELYEKAFDLGLKDSKRTEVYINTLINSPLTTEAQEKLVKFVATSPDDLVKLKAEMFLYDLKREIHRKYPDNFILNSVYNQKILRWSKLPIKYAFLDSGSIPKYFIKEIENAFTEWEKSTGHQILFEEDSEKPDIVIKFESKHPVSAEKGQKFVVAYTTPILNLNQLKNMEITFYLKEPSGKNFSPNQVYNTALHEIAHALGCMGHSDEKTDIMYLTKDSKNVINDKREFLSEADINTIKLLYEIKPEITDSADAKGKYIPFLILGTNKEVNNEKISEAMFYVRKAPNLPSGYIDLAEGYVVAKDYNNAIKSLEKALSLADNDEIKGMIYFNLAVVNLYADKLERSKKYLEKSIKIKASEEKSYLLGEIYVREGKNNEAIKIYSDLIMKNSKNIEYVIALTNIYVLNRDFINARKILEDFIKNSPGERNNPRLNPYGILKLGL